MKEKMFRIEEGQQSKTQIQVLVLSHAETVNKLWNFSEPLME